MKLHIHSANEIIELSVRSVKEKLSNIEKNKKESKENYISRKEIMRIEYLEKELNSRITKILHNFPSINDLESANIDLFKLNFNIKEIKQALAHISATRQLIRKISRNYISKIKRNKKASAKYRREAFGRIFSIVKKLKNSLSLLQSAVKVIKKLPKFHKLKTAVLVGLPNVGKSTFIKAITGSKVEIQPYAFTTKKLQVGLFEKNFKKYQLIDAPGIINDKELNAIEKQVLIAIKNLASLIIFIIDAKQSITKQKHLIKKISKKYNIKSIYILSKIDLIEKEELEKIKKLINFDKAYNLNNLNKKEIEEIKDLIINSF